MTKFALIFGVFAVSFAAQAKTYTCTGVNDNKGTEVVLKLNGNNYSAYGTAVEGEGFSATVNCSGKYTDSKNKYDIYSTNTNARTCPVDYVKIMTELTTGGSGMLVLARTSGGDTHDSSGYSYRYYHCE